MNPFPGDNGTMEIVVIGLAIALLTSLAFLAWRLKISSAVEPVRKEPFILPPGVALRPQPLLNDTDLLLYNLIRLAVEDHYLVFARVSLWSIVSVEAERTIRSQVLRQIALKQLDFVLVHPGTKTADHVVLLDAEAPPQPHEATRKREIQSVLQAAGIPLTILSPNTSYTVSQLAQLLGVSEDD